MDFIAELGSTVRLFFFTLEHEPMMLYFTVGLVGLVVGSFLNVVIHRLPVMMFNELRQQCQEYLSLSDDSCSEDKPKKFNLNTPGSHCPHCQHRICFWENIPILSYLFLAGRCSSCKTGISFRYPLIEFFTAFLGLIVCWQLGYGVSLIFVLIFTWALLAASAIDFDHQLLPDQIILPLLWLGIIFNLFFQGFTSLEASIIGAIAGYLSLWSFYWIFKLFTGKEGMGHGDFKLLALLGAWLGWQALPTIILLSSLVGSVIGVGLILILGRDKNIPIPFGPFLAGAGWLTLLWGTELQQLYFSIAF
ncbi:A24 family peptidase [Candidatus Albibeggiatoa sp. nov. BB20]|uniref:prepilin peptidase n=1 Tax=Candidatus Albibeggiatoa sp. nov. BB20 TaxID=3162723 RepID=UPI0033657EE7